MNNPKISVLMSVYNGEKYLNNSIESILNQTFNDFEFIIINDGSTDKTLSIIKSYAATDQRIKIISRENKGLITSLNEGITLATGKYIARMDADDISHPTRFDKQVKFLDSNKKIGVLGSWVEFFGEEIEKKIWKTPSDNISCQMRLIFSVPFAHPSVMMRKEIFEKFDIRYCNEYKNAEDYDLWVQLAKHTEYSNLKEPLLKYRYLETSISRRSDSKANSEKRYEIIKNIFTNVLQKYNLKNSDKENLIHYTIGQRNRYYFFKPKVISVFAYLIKLNMKIKNLEFFIYSLKRLFDYLFFRIFG